MRLVVMVMVLVIPHTLLMQIIKITAAIAFGSMAVDDPTTPWDETLNWNPGAGLNNDGLIDIFDLVVIGINYGKTW